MSITFQGREWAYDVDFQVIKDSLEEPVPSELEGYFRLRESAKNVQIAQDSIYTIKANAADKKMNTSST